MKLSIARRLAAILATIGILAAGLTGYYAYQASRDLMVHAAEERLLTATRVLMRQITNTLDDGARNVRLLAGHPRAATALIAPPGQRETAEDEVALLFREMLRTRPEISQIRLISADEYGIERVRIDRDHNGLLQIRGADLQEKGHLPYVFETLGLPRGAVYISTPFINRETGTQASEGQPSLYMAAPIYGERDAPAGLVIVNIDLDGMFHQLSGDLPGNIGLYLASDQGDFLVHPDRSKAFAFEQGRRALVQEQFPATAPLVAGQVNDVVTIARTGKDSGGMLATFIRERFSSPQTDAYYILGLSESMSAVLKENDELGRMILKIVAAFSALSIVVATLFARAVTGPLTAMTKTVKRFAAIQERGPLPVARQDEIGVLARSVDDMQQRIETQVATLQNKQRELDHLASSDALTGLPNRRVFFDRLEQALARARRTERQLAILFIDLDHFKEINDSLGHAVGDIMLEAIAARLRTSVREVDTVARLGGDEFIILIENVDSIESISRIAQKIIEAVAAPVPYNETTLAVGASIGAAIFPNDGTTATEIVASADQAMYRAKLGGRNRVGLATVSEEMSAMRIGL